MSILRALVVAAFITFTQTSCFMPTALPKTIAADIPKAETKSIHEGETSKGDIRHQFGDPDWSSVDDARWIFEMRQYFPWGWHMCIAYGGQGGCAEVGERPIKIEYLDLRFDASGIVEEWSTPAVESGECIDDVVCIDTEQDEVGSTVSYHLRNGPGADSLEFHAAIRAEAYDGSLITARFADWFEGSYGFDDARPIALDDPAGVLAVTKYDVIFFVWSGEDYLLTKTISRKNLQDVVVEAKGKSRRLILVTVSEYNTFEIVADSRWFVDVDGTESIAEVLRKPMSRQ